MFLNIKFIFSPAYETRMYNILLCYLIYLIYFIDRGQPNWEAIKRKLHKNTNLFAIENFKNRYIQCGMLLFSNEKILFIKFHISFL